MRKDSKGAAAIEYALLACCIAAAIVLSLRGVGTGVSETVNHAADNMAVSDQLEFQTQ